MTKARDLSAFPNTGFAFKNRIINGAMVIDQRNAGASVTASATAAYTYTLDRWFYVVSQASKMTVQQNAGSVTPPVGFNNYLGVTSSSAYSVGTNDYFVVGQKIEGFNFADLGWGTANAKTVTLSFWVRSSLTGTFGGVFRNGNDDRTYAFTYTISSANTWEQKSVTVAGDTTGTWAGATNGVAVQIFFGLGLGASQSISAGSWTAGSYGGATGATSVVGTNGATFYITGVQLEVGSTATSFDYRPYGTELQLCQRYYCKSSDINVVAANGNAYQDAGKFSAGILNSFAANAGYTQFIQYPVNMRAIPTVTFIRTNLGGTLNGTWTIYDGVSNTWESPSSQAVQSSLTTGFNCYIDGTFGTNPNMWYGAWTASAEL